MLFPILTFVLVFAIVLGAYWALILRPERATETALRKRLGAGLVPRVAGAGPSIRAEVQRLSSMPAFDRLLASRTHLVMPLQRLIDQSAVKTTVGVLLLGSAALFLFGVLLGRVSFGATWAGGLIGAAAAPAPSLYLMWKRSKRVLKFEELLPEAIDLMTRAIRAGHGFTTAVGMVADELPEPIATEFKLLHDRQNFGLPLDEALKDFSERVPILSAKFFVTAVLTQRETGGNLAEVLGNLASVIRDRFNVMRQVRIKSAHGRMTGIVLGGLPPALVMVLLIISPDYLSVMLQDPVGVQMIVIAVALQIVGVLIIRKLVRIEY